jgi:hypothetical protein
MTEYKKINESSWHDFGKKLSQKGKEKQILSSFVFSLTPSICSNNPL